MCLILKLSAPPCIRSSQLLAKTTTTTMSSVNNYVNKS